MGPSLTGALWHWRTPHSTPIERPAETVAQVPAWVVSAAEVAGVDYPVVAAPRRSPTKATVVGMAAGRTAAQQAPTRAARAASAVAVRVDIRMGTQEEQEGLAGVAVVEEAMAQARVAEEDLGRAAAGLVVVPLTARYRGLAALAAVAALWVKTAVISVVPAAVARV